MEEKTGGRDLNKIELKKGLRAMRIQGNKDPFDLYQQGLISKGKLLDVIVIDIMEYLKSTKR